MIEDRTEARIDILLATYNGAAFLEEQIGSILQQSHRNWRLLVRDDGSTDRTPEIIRQAADDHPEKIVLISDDAGNLGCNGNFNRLMELSTADYVAFCDQDDVWLEEKLSLSMRRMRALEGDHGAEVPLLVHTDLCTVDESLRVIGPSFWRYQGLRPANANQFGRLLIYNVVTGCSMLINRALKDRALPVPAEAKVHDWWIALVAAAFGVAGDVATPTALYRQHDRNTTGAQAFAGWKFLIRACEFAGNGPGSRARLLETLRQAKAFHARYRSELRPGDRGVLDDALAIPESGLFARLSRALRHGGPTPAGLYWLAFALFAPSPAQVASDTIAPLPSGGNRNQDRAVR